MGDVPALFLRYSGEETARVPKSVPAWQNTFHLGLRSMAMCRNALAWRGVGLFALVLLLVGAPNAYGDVVWQTTANSSWDTVTNWTATLGETLPPDAAGVVVDFSTLEITSDVIVTLDDSGDGTRTVGTLKFGDTSASNNWIINAGTAGSITLATSIGTPTIEVVNQTATINAVVAGTQGFAKTGAGTLVLGNTANTFTGTDRAERGRAERGRGRRVG